MQGPRAHAQRYEGIRAVAGIQGRLRPRTAHTTLISAPFFTNSMAAMGCLVYTAVLSGVSPCAPNGVASGLCGKARWVDECENAAAPSIGECIAGSEFW
jgi:hypothetical protein